MQNNQKNIVSAIIIAGVLIAGAILLKGKTPPVEKSNSSYMAEIDIKPISQEEHILGNPEAKIIVVEYSDTECPFCKKFHDTMHTVIQQNNNIAWVYRHYPIESLHPKALHEAEATECAWEQGGNDIFWKYIDEIYIRTQSNNKLEVEELPKIAKDLNLDIPSFNICLESGKYKEKIKNGMTDVGSVGTPYSVIIASKNISEKTQEEILQNLNLPKDTPQPAISFSTTRKNMMSLNGSLPIEMINKIINILLK